MQKIVPHLMGLITTFSLSENKKKRAEDVSARFHAPRRSLRQEDHVFCPTDPIAGAVGQVGGVEALIA